MEFSTPARFPSSLSVSEASMRSERLPTEIRFAVAQQPVDHRLAIGQVAGAEMTAVDHVERRLELAVAGDDFAGRITGHPLRSDLLGRESEDENVLGADLL